MILVKESLLVIPKSSAASRQLTFRVMLLELVINRPNKVYKLQVERSGTNN